MQNQYLFEFGPFCLDTVERLLFRENQPVSLPPKAFDTLVLLVENSGRLLEKQFLLDHLWPETEVEENSLSQCIYLLRRTLGDEINGKCVYIQTVSRHGYRFAAPVRNVPNNKQVHIKDIDAYTAGPGPGSGSIVPLSNRLFAFVLVTFSVLVIPLMTWIFFRHASSSANQPRDHVEAKPKVLAILPFRSVGSNDKMEYLELGLADALITRLSESGELNILPVEDVQRYSGRQINDPIIAGRELGADQVLHGSVQANGQQIRVTVQLLNVRTGTTLWGKQVDASLHDVFELEDTVANEVAIVLVPKFALSQQHHHDRPTNNGEAYDDYMKGRFFWSKRTAQSLITAVGFFQQAIAKDPRYAQAYAGMADAYALLGFYDFVPPGRELSEGEGSSFESCGT